MPTFVVCYTQWSTGTPPDAEEALKQLALPGAPTEFEWEFTDGDSTVRLKSHKQGLEIAGHIAGALLHMRAAVHDGLVVSSAVVARGKKQLEALSKHAVGFDAPFLDAAAQEAFAGDLCHLEAVTIANKKLTQECGLPILAALISVLKLDGGWRDRVAAHYYTAWAAQIADGDGVSHTSQLLVAAQHHIDNIRNYEAHSAYVSEWVDCVWLRVYPGGMSPPAYPDRPVIPTVSPTDAMRTLHMNQPRRREYHHRHHACVPGCTVCYCAGYCVGQQHDEYYHHYHHIPAARPRPHSGCIHYIGSGCRRATHRDCDARTWLLLRAAALRHS